MTNLTTLIIELSSFFYTRNQNELAIFMKKNSLENFLVFLMNQIYLIFQILITSIHSFMTLFFECVNVHAKNLTCF